jgi:hypothetical protein
MFFRTWLISVFFLGLVAPGHAQITDIQQLITKGGVQAELQPKQLYRIHVRCQARGSLDNLNTIERGVFSSVTFTISHSVVISTDQPVLNPAANTDDMPKNIIALIPSYAVRAADKRDNRRSCGGDWFVVGGTKYFLITSKTQSETNAPALFTRVIFKIPDIIPPLWSLFRTGAIPDDVTKKLGNVKALEDPLKNLLSTFDNQNNITRTEPLLEGSFRIRTTFSIIDISVSKIPALVPDFASQLRKQQDAATEKISAADPATDCGTISDKLSIAGLSMDMDIPFALGYAASKSFPTKEGKANVLKCLTSDYAMKAAQLGPVLWNTFPESRRVTFDDVLGTFPPPLDDIPPQPVFGPVQARIDDFVATLARSTLNDPTAPDDIAELLRVATAKISLIDKTDVRIFSDAPTNADLPVVVTYLKDKGYKRFGCYKQNAEDNKLDGAIVTFLGFKANKDDKSVPTDKVVVLRPLFLGLKIARLLIYNNKPDWMTALLTQNTCGGLKIEMPQTAAVWPRSDHPRP